QASQTGQETTAEVSDVLQLGKIVGFEGTDNDNEIEEVNATVRLASGSDPINLSEASYTFATNGYASVVNGNPNANGDVVTHHQVQGLDAGTHILSDQEDLMVVNFNLSNMSGDLQAIQTSQKLTIVAQAPAGGQSYKEVQAPRQIQDGESYIL
ncbi:MAG: hypothetical protein ABEH61_00880, partial [Haloarculaceae archaeon]